VSDPAYPAAVLRAALTTEPSGVVALVQPLTEVMLNRDLAPAAMKGILTAVVAMMEKNPLTVPEVARTHYFYVLPVTTDEMLDLCIRSAIQLFENGHKALNSYIVRVLSGLIQKRPAQMLVIFQPLVRHFPSLPDAWEVSDLLLQMKSFALNVPEGRMVLSLLYSLVTQSHGYMSQRGTHVVSVFAYFLQSTVPSTVVCAYMGLAQLAPIKATYTAEDFQPVMAHLASGVFWPSALILLLRLREYPITDELLYLLTVRAAESPLALLVLMQLTNSPLASGLILKYRTNLEIPAARFPTLTFSLLVTLCHTLGQKQFFECDTKFPELLRVFVATGNPEILLGIVRLLRAMRMNKELAYAIGDCRLLPVFAVAISKGQDPALPAAFLAFELQVAKVMFLRDFLTCQRVVLEMLDRPDLVEPVLILLNQLLVWPDSRASLKAAGIAKKIAAHKGNPKVADIAQKVLTGLS
jgi:hypothetical protein